MPPAKHPITDLLVVLPGILGSTLVRDGKEVWAPSAGSAMRIIRSVGGVLKRLQLPQGIGDNDPRDGVAPCRLMPDLHILPGLWSPVHGYTGLLDFLRDSFDVTEGRNLLPVPYDWRLSNRFNGRRLKSIVEPALEQWRAQCGPFTEAKLVFICHSMGGLVARWYLEMEGGRPLTRKLITLGTPHRGSLKALEQLVNGVRKGPGPFKLDLTDFSRSLPSLYQLLPEYACINDGDPRGLHKLTELPLPPVVNGAMLADAMRFHDQINAAVARAGPAGYDVHPIVGTLQPTWTTAELVYGTVRPVETINGVDEHGDGTVPRVSTPKELRPNHPSILPVAEEHGRLQVNSAIYDALEFALTGQPVIHKAPEPIELGVRVEDTLDAGEPLTVEATLSRPRPATLLAVVTNERGAEVDRLRLLPADGGYRAVFPSLPEGAHRVTVSAVGAAEIAPLTRTVLVWGDTTDAR